MGVVFIGPFNESRVGHLMQSTHLPDESNSRVIIYRFAAPRLSANGAFKIAQGFSPGRIIAMALNPLSLWERVRVRDFL